MAPTPEAIKVNIVPNTPPPSTVSPKVWASTVGTLVASLAMALLAALIDNPAELAAMLDAVPSWARFLIVASLPTLLSFAAGYVKRDTTRELGVAVRDRLSTGSDEPAVAELDEDELAPADPLMTAHDPEYRGEHHAK